MYMKQKLRFENFLKDYVRDLSFGTTSIKKLVAECEDFPKLREPLLLYAKFNGKLKLLYSVLEKTPNGELQHLCDTYGSTLSSSWSNRMRTFRSGCGASGPVM